MEKKQSFKYKLQAHIIKLHLNKNINFETKIIWKRNVNKAETQTVSHLNSESLFNQTLQLQLNLAFNPQENKFDEKYTEFSVTVIYQGKAKSGGFVKYDVSEIVNKNFHYKPIRLNLSQCPDPDAFLDVQFSFETDEHSSRSLFNQLSILNQNGMQNDLSQIDFNEESHHQDEEIDDSDNNQKQTNVKQSEVTKSETQKIKEIVNKFQTLARNIKFSKLSTEDDISTKNTSMQLSNEQEEKLKNRIRNLQKQLSQCSQQLAQCYDTIKRKDKKIIELEVKINQLIEKAQFLQQDVKQKQNLSLIIAQREQKYKNLYEQSVSQMQKLKSNNWNINISKSLGFQNIIEEAHEINETANFNLQNQEIISLKCKVEHLQRENNELQNKIAAVSINIAQLFNAAFQFGGEKLLDHLHNSMGLIQS